ncbi:zinc-binding dehydrogenase [Streptomyces sp. NPDC020951]|uniref:zinc-binding dehydrogenase n=1 Tax=Streptomyces sp. NPDC020951 TaxID=3365104 RepID=UPI0037B5713C
MPTPLRGLAALIADRHLEIRIEGVYRLDEVREIFRKLERRRMNGKILLRFDGPSCIRRLKHFASHSKHRSKP